MMVSRWSCAVAAVFLACLSLDASAQKAPPPLVESIDVEVVNLDVVVVDKHGRRVTGLQKKDFRVEEDGKPQEISNFAEYRLTPQPAGPRVHRVAVGDDTSSVETARREPLRLVIFIDNTSLRFGNRARVATQLKKFVAEALQPGDQVSVVAWGRYLATALPFSADRSLVDRAIDVATRRHAGGHDEDNDAADIQERQEFRSRVGDVGGTTPADAARFEAEAVAFDRYKLLMQTANAVRSTIVKFSGQEGKKAILIVSEGFAANALGAGTIAPPNPLFNTVHFMEPVVDAANANNVTLYTMHAAGLPVAGNAEGGSAASAGAVDAAMNNTLLGMLSEKTGGIYKFASNTSDEFFADVAEDVNSYYSLAYHTQGRRDGVKHKVRVTTVNRDYEVRSRTNFVQRSAEDKVKDELVASLFYPTQKNDMHAVVSIGNAKQKGRKRYLVPLEVQFPFSAMTFIRQGAQQVGGFQVFLVSADDPELTSDTTQKSQRVAIPIQKFERAKTQMCSYSVELLTSGRGGSVAVALRDEISGAVSMLKVPLPAAVK